MAEDILSLLYLSQLLKSFLLLKPGTRYHIDFYLTSALAMKCAFKSGFKFLLGLAIY